MSRIAPLDAAEAPQNVRDLYAVAQGALGGVPNFIRALGHAPAALQGFLQLFGSLTSGTIDHKTHERIALLTAEANACQYCVSAHTVLARGAGLSEGEIAANREGRSTEAKADAAVRFAGSVLENKGDVTAAEYQALLSAGWTAEQAIEIVLTVGMNSLLNAFGRFSQIDIDFPKVELNKAA